MAIVYGVLVKTSNAKLLKGRTQYCISIRFRSDNIQSILLHINQYKEKCLINDIHVIFPFPVSANTHGVHTLRVILEITY